jgi:hypothetical protein
MPYIRQRTWIQAGPRIVGMGLGPCDPGFVGPVSPEEQAACAAAASIPDYQTVSTPSGDYQIIAGKIYDPSGKLVTGIPSGGGIPGAPASVNDFFQQYKTPLLIGGIGFGALLLIKALR